ncbi:MAG: ribonuclease HII [Elusimicrobiota bacterium]
MNIIRDENSQQRPRQKAGLFYFDSQLMLKNESDCLIGVDEAGRGPLAGPVLACAAWLPESASRQLSEIDDSKKLTEKKRRELFIKMLSLGVKYSCAWTLPETIDRVNILNATFMAMKKACDCLISSLPFSAERTLVIVDGPLRIKDFKGRQMPLVDADAKSQSVAAASIFAKTIRDRWMEVIDTKYPQYGFISHKGYGTKKHMESLRAHGPCQWHRRSFAPVREICAL